MITSNDLIDPHEYSNVVKTLRNFFDGRGFIEVPVQHRLSILAACEDPRTIATYTYSGKLWPLPQTGQMWLEYELLSDPNATGYYCVSTSFREEPNPIPGRHDLVFPMFEFELKGDMHTLIKLERDLLNHLSFMSTYHMLDYTTTAEKYDTIEIEARHETKLNEDYGPVVFLIKFPQHTSPFWNMKKVEEKFANKVDVVLYGIETIGSAERSTDREEMRDCFHNISNGMYADILFSRFGRERVEEELNRYLTFDFFPRCGGGIGITRMIRALKLLRKIN